MRKLFLILSGIILACTSAYADLETDKLMSKITRDAKNYISADVRAATEDEAYAKALAELSKKIVNYFESEGKETPNEVFLTRLSSHSERLISQLGNNRCRVLLYVNKKDLFPVDGNDNSVLLSMNKDNRLEVVNSNSNSNKPNSGSGEKEQTKANHSPVLDKIASCKNASELNTTLKALRAESKIGGAALFPLSSADNFYLVVVDASKQVVAMMHVVDGKYRDLNTGKELNIENYTNCSAYWITPNK